eukprot:1389670-Amorphochlora_amoeboformis.AAC.2
MGNEYPLEGTQFSKNQNQPKGMSSTTKYEPTSSSGSQSFRSLSPKIHPAWEPTLMASLIRYYYFFSRVVPIQTHSKPSSLSNLIIEKRKDHACDSPLSLVPMHIHRCLRVAIPAPRFPRRIVEKFPDGYLWRNSLNPDRVGRRKFKERHRLGNFDAKQLGW